MKTFLMISSLIFQENILDILVEHHGRVNYVLNGFNRFNEERKGMADCLSLIVLGLLNVSPLPILKSEGTLYYLPITPSFHPFYAQAIPVVL